MRRLPAHDPEKPKSLREIAAMMDLGLPTVRTILDRDNGSDRMTKKRWEKLHPGEKWKERSYTPVGALTRIDAKQFVRSRGARGLGQRCRSVSPRRSNAGVSW